MAPDGMGFFRPWEFFIVPDDDTDGSTEEYESDEEIEFASPTTRVGYQHDDDDDSYFDLGTPIQFIIDDDEPGSTFDNPIDLTCDEDN